MESRSPSAASQTITATIIASIVLGSLGYVFVEDVLRILGASPEALPLATTYMQILSLGVTAMFEILSVIGVVVWLFPRLIVAAFTTDPAVIDVGTTFIRIVAPMFGFIGIMRAFNGGFRGTGYTLIAAAIALLTLGGVRLPVAWIGANLIGSTGIWYALAVSNVVGAVIAFAWFAARAGERAPNRASIRRPAKSWRRPAGTEAYKPMIDQAKHLHRNRQYR